MEQMEDQNCEQFVQIYDIPANPDDVRFDQVVFILQQVVIDPEFEKMLTTFMRQHWQVLDANSDVQTVFHLYRQQMQAYLQQKIRVWVPDFEWGPFGELFASRRNRVDEQIMDTLLSLEQIEAFKLFIKDYRNSYEEEEQFRVLTIKSTKAPESKKVKGKDNIFAAEGGAGMFDKGLKMPLSKKSSAKEKTEQELLVPDLILTVRPLRKG